MSRFLVSFPILRDPSMLLPFTIMRDVFIFCISFTILRDVFFLYILYDTERCLDVSILYDNEGCLYFWYPLRLCGRSRILVPFMIISVGVIFSTTTVNVVLIFGIFFDSDGSLNFSNIIQYFIFLHCFWIVHTHKVNE